MKKKGLVIIPYANGGNTGVSIKNIGGQLETYMKNVCTAALSAGENAGDGADVMLVSNIRIPELYADLLEPRGILLEYCPFERFNFGTESNGGKKVNWQLAFYKLCALEHCVNRFDYDCYCYLDSDVFVQRSFDRIWEEARHNIMLYDVDEPADGYMVREMRRYLGTETYPTHWGGEFFAASKTLATSFVEECEKIFAEMIEADYITDSGDEFISSIAAHRLRASVKNAAAYIRRYWTGSYRLVCNDFEKNNITILHLPAEKERGIIKIFDRYISKGVVPRKQIVWRMAHLRRRSPRVVLGAALRKAGIVR